MKLSDLKRSLAAFICALVQVTSLVQAENQPEKLEWLKDAGLGLFIHWSVDSQLGIVISHSVVGASDQYNRNFFEELP